MLNFIKTNEPILRKLTNRQKDGRTDGPYFIRPFWPRPGVQKEAKFILNRQASQRNTTEKI